MTAQPTTNWVRQRIEVEIGERINLTFVSPNREQKARGRQLLAHFDEIGLTKADISTPPEQVEAANQQLEELLAENLVSATVRNEGGELVEVPNWKEEVADAGYLRDADGVSILVSTFFRPWRKAAHNGQGGPGGAEEEQGS